MRIVFLWKNVKERWRTAWGRGRESKNTEPRPLWCRAGMAGEGVGADAPTFSCSSRCLSC